MGWPTDDPEPYFANRGFPLLVIRDASTGDYTADILAAGQEPLRGCALLVRRVRGGSSGERRPSLAR